MDPASLGAVAILIGATIYAVARKALFSLVYAVAILAVYGLQVATAPFGFVFLSPIVGDLGLIVLSGRPPTPWSWITFEFVHGSETHVLLNVLGLLLISPRFEDRIGSPRWALVFFAGGAFGALVFVLLHLGSSSGLVGASAGIFAVLGGFGRLYPRERVTFLLPLPRMPSLRVSQVVIVFLVLETVLGFVAGSGIAWHAHAGALVFGFAAAPLLARLPIPGGPQRGVTVEGLRSLAVTRELRGILEEVERADLPETRGAWVDAFVRAARCPRCAGPLRRRFGRLVSACGWSQTL